MAVAVERAPSRTQRVFGETPTAWLWVTPAVVIILGLSLVPMAWALLLSFQHNDLVTPSTWIGLRNYSRLLDDPTFRGAVEHTLLYTVAFVPLSIAGGLGIALMLNRRVRFVGLYRTLVFVPYIMSATAQGVLFSFVFDSQFGVANSVLHHLGIPAPGLPPGPGPGAVGAGADRAVERHRLLGDRLPGGAAGHPAGAGRGGVDRRRAALGRAPPRRAAGAEPGDGLPVRVADVRVAAAVRPRVRDHARRAAAVDDGGRALRVAAGVPVLQRRLRRGGGLRARVRAARRGARVGLVPAAAARRGWHDGAADQPVAPRARADGADLRAAADLADGLVVHDERADQPLPAHDHPRRRCTSTATATCSGPATSATGS